jgi:hypothetical protein
MGFIAMLICLYLIAILYIEISDSGGNGSGFGFGFLVGLLKLGVERLQARSAYKLVPYLDAERPGLLVAAPTTEVASGNHYAHGSVSSSVGIRALGQLSNNT